MSRLRQLVLGNWPLKLAALGLATVLYAGVALPESTRTWNDPVPIEVLGAPAGGALLELPGAVEDIRYQASQEVASQLAADSFRASIDLSEIEPRDGAKPVPVVVDVFPVDPRVRVVDHSPRSINVKLDTVVTRALPVTIDPGAIPDGIELGPVISEPSQVSVSGASSRIQGVRSVTGRIPVDASGINIDQDVTVEAFDDSGALVPGVEIDPPRVRVSVDVARQLRYATLPVLVELTGEPARGRRVDNVSVLPATVTVSGEDGAVRQLESIATDPVDIGGQGDEVVVEVPLTLPDEVTAPAGATATVSVTFTDDVGSRSIELGTALLGTRTDRTYRIEDPVVTLVAAGPLIQLDELGVEELIAAVPVGALDIGDHDVTPIVDVPAGLRVTRITPETVRVAVGQPS